MRKKNLIFWILAVVLIFAMQASAYDSVGEGIYACNSCSDCTNALNDSTYYSEVRLTSDIVNQSGSCIDNPENFNNKVFDCQEHRIDGDGMCYGSDYGIRMHGKSGNTVRNCNVTEFYDGIYFEDSSKNTVTGNTADSNLYSGIYLYDSSNNTLTNNTANSNSEYGIRLSDSSHNTITGNTASNNDWGIFLQHSSSNTITNNTANSNYEDGIELDSSSNNIVTGNTANSNNDYGISLTYSNSTINSNHACDNTETDFFLYGSTGKIGDENTCDNPGRWNDTGTSGCTYSCGETTTSTTTKISTSTTTTTLQKGIPEDAKEDRDESLVWLLGFLILAFFIIVWLKKK